MNDQLKVAAENKQSTNESHGFGAPEFEGGFGGALLGNEASAIQRAANNSPAVKQLMAFQAAADTSRQVRQLRALQTAVNTTPVQRKAESSGSGLPGQLQAGIEQLSGVSMEGVNVHMNSDMPAQMQAHAYAQGSDIHIAPGQEQHLPHEAWHVAQQRQGRVQANTSVGGSPVNDSPALEQEADSMGAKAMQMKLDDRPQGMDAGNPSPVAQRQAVQSPVVQRVIALGGELFAQGLTSGLKTEEKQAQWVASIGNAMGYDGVNIAPINFINRFDVAGQARYKVLQQLNDPINMYTYHYDAALSDMLQVDGAERTPMLQPKDMIPEADDLNAVYNSSLACVLQALANAGVANGNVADPTNPEQLHDYYYNQQGIQYDDDVAAYEIYTGLGLTLVRNTPANWSTLNLPDGTYIFSSQGHNFCVVVNDNVDPNLKYTCRDEPQRIQLRYQADLSIHYVWKAP